MSGLNFAEHSRRGNDERAEADKMIARGAEAAEVAVRDGVKRAMDQFNG